MPKKASVGILGGGFAGLFTVFHLERLLASDVEITLFDRNNYFLYTPMLHEVATGSVEARHVVVPVRKVVNPSRCHIRTEEVVRIHLLAKSIETGSGQFVFDHLVLAPGSEVNFYGIEGLEQNAVTFKSISDVTGLRNRIIDTLERGALEHEHGRRKRILTINVAGAGCTGVELSAEIAQFVRLILGRDYPEIDRRDVKINLLEASEKVLPYFPPYLSRIALKRLIAMGIDVHLNSPIERVREEAVVLKGGIQVPRGILIWTGGVKARSLPLHPEVAKGTINRIVVSGSLEIPNHPDVYVIGDGAYLIQDNEPLPCTASVAVQEARYVARAIRNRLKNKKTEAFRFRYRGDMVSLGFMFGVCEVYGRQLQGFSAWLIWKAFKLAMLPRHKNRFQILSDWLLTWIFKRDTSRLM